MRLTTLKRAPAADAPQAPLVVLLHGLEDAGSTWTPFVAAAPSAARFAAPDMPWHVGNDYRWRRHGSPGQWLARFLESLGEEPVALVGHSFGANAILELLANDQVAVARAVLYAPFFRPANVPLSWSLLDRSRATFEQQIRDSVSARLGDRAARLADDVLDRMTRAALDRIGPAGFLAAFDQYMATAELDLESVTVPTLVLIGEDDPVLRLTGARALQAVMPSASVLRTDRLDHFSHIRSAGEIRRTIDEFLSPAITPDAWPSRLLGGAS